MSLIGDININWYLTKNKSIEFDERFSISWWSDYLGLIDLGSSARHDSGLCRLWTVIRRPDGRASRSLVSWSTTMPPLSQWLRTCRNHCCHHCNRVLLTFSLVCAVQILLSSLNELTDELEFWNVQCSSEFDDIAEDCKTSSFSFSKSPTVISQNGRKL